MEVERKAFDVIGSPPTNGAAEIIEWSVPYRVQLGIEGHADYLYHAWNDDAVEAKAKAAKGSKAKKSDDVESYVVREEDGELCILGTHIKGAIKHAAKYFQDPRSPRKSAFDLFNAGVHSLTPLARTGLRTWDYIDRQRVVVQRNSITRCRPALRKPWRVEFVLLVTVPEYISADLLQQVVTRAGQLCGIGDNRPTYGRFGIVGFNVLTE